MAKNKNKSSGSEREGRFLRRAILLVALLAVGVAAFGIGHWITGERVKERSAEAADGALLTKVSVGNTYAEIVQDGEDYQICASLPVDTDITQISCTLELDGGTLLEQESNCILNDLGGQLILNLGVQEPQLTIADEEGQTQVYRFALSILEEEEAAE